VIALRADLKVVMAAHPVDFRKSVHTLSALVSEALRANPYCGDVFVFRSKRADRVKLLAWHGSGMVLVTKWLHQGGFTWPPIRDGVVHLSASQLTMLLDGLDWTRVSPKPVGNRLWSDEMRISLEPMPSACIFLIWRFVPKPSRLTQRR
jgi:transposase